MTDINRFYKRLGDRIRVLRKKLRMTQVELARRVDLTRTSVTNIEQGRQKMLAHTLADFANALGAQAVDLFPHPELASPIPDGLAPSAQEFVDSVVKRVNKGR